MADEAMVPIQKITLGGATASISFNSIPSIYKDLWIMTNHISAANDPFLRIRMNGATTNLYMRAFVENNGLSSVYRETGGPGSSIEINLYSQGSGVRASMANIHLLDYANTSRFKSVLAQVYSGESDTTGDMTFAAGQLRTTSAINSVNLFLTSSSFSAGSQFQLWGVIG